MAIAGAQNPVDRCGSPGRPAPLRRSGQHKPGDFEAAAYAAEAVLGDRVHRAHDALRHRQPQGPSLVAGPQVFVPAIGDDPVLDAWIDLPRKGQRLIWNHTQFGSDRSGHRRRNRQQRVRPGWRRLVVRAAGDDQQCRVAGELVGHDEAQPVLPAWPVHLALTAPTLRDEFQKVGGVAAARLRCDRLPPIAGSGNAT